ncbi:hypothetical protein QCA50_001697 [Cerrena zonata]|uniref:Uncharacterized protein n=1 Tax=Cerrena zonata TaxID=2478898 RepID=A0AAW0GP53_9APHY
MSSSGRPQHLRRRSQSASANLSAYSHLDSDKWHKASKRPRPSFLRSPTLQKVKSDLPEKWEIDFWRRGKKARKGSSSPKNAAASVFQLAPSIHDPDSFSRVSSGFPSTSAAFQLFPNRPRRSCRSPRHTPRSSQPLSPVDLELPSVEEADRLRTDAFWDLHRSIAESGDGFVSRMREWESTHHQAQTYAQTSNYGPSELSQPSRGRKRVAPTYEEQPGDFDSMDEEDDIVIVSHDDCQPPLKKRALSMSVMKGNPYSIGASSISSRASERCSSPIDIIEDEDDFPSSTPCTSPITPALTHASASSSLVSLVLSAPTIHDQSSYLPGAGSFSGPSTPHSERAVAALALAMANGAGGLNDYADVLHLEGQQELPMNQSSIGDMWD